MRAGHGGGRPRDAASSRGGRRGAGRGGHGLCGDGARGCWGGVPGSRGRGGSGGARGRGGGAGGGELGGAGGVVAGRGQGLGAEAARGVPGGDLGRGPLGGSLEVGLLHRLVLLALREVLGARRGGDLGVDGRGAGLRGGELLEAQLELLDLLEQGLLLFLLLEEVGLEGDDGLAEREVVGEEERVHHVLQLVVQRGRGVVDFFQHLDDLLGRGLGVIVLDRRAGARGLD